MTMSDNEHSVHVAVGVICRHGLLLVTQRSDEKPYGGYWELPGGKVEGTESPEEALCRELAEELGISVKNFQPLEVLKHNYKDSDLIAILHFFKVSAFDGEPCAKENQNLRWIEPKDVPELDFLPADRALLNRLFPVGQSGICES